MVVPSPLTPVPAKRAVPCEFGLMGNEGDLKSGDHSTVERQGEIDGRCCTESIAPPRRHAERICNGCYCCGLSSVLNAIDDELIVPGTPQLRHCLIQKVQGRPQPSAAKRNVYSDQFDDDLDAVAEAPSNARTKTLADHVRTESPVPRRAAAGTS